MSTDCPRCGELERVLFAANKLYGELSDELAKRYRRIQQLKAALKTYGRHFIGGDGREACASEYPISFPEEYGRCTCGLEAVLRDTPDG